MSFLYFLLARGSSLTHTILMYNISFSIGQLSIKEMRTLVLSSKIATFISKTDGRMRSQVVLPLTRMVSGLCCSRNMAYSVV